MRYLKGIINLFFTYVRFVSIKIFNYNSFSFSFPNLFPLNTEIELGQKASLSLARGVRAKSGIKLKVRDNAKVVIGDNTAFNYNNLIVSHEEISIGSNCQFGPNVLIYDHDHDYRVPSGIKEMKYKTAPIEIGNDVWIGANVVILRGTKIGNNCVVGAGTVLKGNYQDNMLIVEDKKNKTKEIYSKLD